MSRFYAAYDAPCDESRVSTLCRSAGVGPLTARALLRRGMTSPAQAAAFLHPETQPLHDPLLLPDMPEAVVRICFALRHDERICVYGDYDADGICASAILIRTLERMGGRVTRYIPSRHGEGYGLNEAAVRKLALAHVSLLITVDNGISAIDEIALCRNLGVDVIVTDHHSIGARLPHCTALVSAKRQDSIYPERELCGAGVALKLVQALLPQEDHSLDLALAAVATVADVVPLTGENRAIVRQGLLHAERVLGLRALLLAAGWKEGQPVTEHTLAFLVAPRLNASGRMRSAMRGVELLLSEDAEEAGGIALELERDNLARKDAETAILEQAMAQLDLQKRALLAAHADWNQGVTGIVASRLCERYHRPAILFTEQNGLLTGSGRSPEQIDLFETLSGLSRFFVRFGGHARAAGLTIEKKQYVPFCESFCDAMDAYDADRFEPAYRYEERVTLAQLGVDAVRELESLAPFGTGNPEPAYLLERMELRDVTQMGRDGAHLSATAARDGSSLRLVAFRMGELADSIHAGEAYDLIARPGLNRFGNRERTELYFTALQPAQEPPQDRKVFDAIFLAAVYNESGVGANDAAKAAQWAVSAFDEDAACFTQDALRAVYAAWRHTLSQQPARPERLLEMHTAQELVALLIFLELRFFTLDAQTGLIGPAAQVRFAPLSDSLLFCRLSEGVRQAG